jgi:sarcosine oxidase subunit alpha
MTSQPNRNASGGIIDRARLLDFIFNGRRYQGYEGDSLASALLANGVKVVGRSFKYHRPRGVMTAGPEEPNALVQLATSTAALSPTFSRASFQPASTTRPSWHRPAFG